MSVAVAALLVAERAGFRPGIWVTKPLAALCFVNAALSWGALDTPYGWLVLAGLGFSLVGDVLLIPRSRAVFEIGVGSFLLAHVAYTLAFFVRGVSIWGVGLAIALAGLPLALVLRWLSPHVAAEMRGTVYAYMAVITIMVAAALGLALDGGPLLALAGAVAFYLSDLSVARDRFVVESFVNRLWGLPLYFAAQLMIAASVA